jgi:hypothetical protein
MIDAEVARRHGDIPDAQIGMFLHAGTIRGRAVDRRDGAETERMKLVEQKLNVRRHVVGDEDERRLLLGVHWRARDVPAARS